MASQYKNRRLKRDDSLSATDAAKLATDQAPEVRIGGKGKCERCKDVWGFLICWDLQGGAGAAVLKNRCACPSRDSASDAITKFDAETKPNNEETCENGALQAEEAYERTKVSRIASCGYLIGSHRECDFVIRDAAVSERHCLLFSESNGSDSVALLESFSSSGTLVRGKPVSCNQRREIKDGDMIMVHRSRFTFRYPIDRSSIAFSQRYSKKDKIGNGNFGEVYRCTEKSTGKQFAVKVFPKSSRKVKLSERSLQAEVGILMSVSHPNVICLMDAFNEKANAYLIVEFAPKGDLFHHLRVERYMSEGNAAHIFKQLLQGIKYLHERDIVHRDIKPENILVMSDGLHVKIADFGLAKIVDRESFLTSLCGTPEYIAPEILADPKSCRYTTAVDIWSLGVVLYTCLCGFTPFAKELRTEDNSMALVKQIITARFDYPSPYWDSVGDTALDLIDKILVPDAEFRFTAEDCLTHKWLTRSLGDSRSSNYDAEDDR